MSTSSAKPRDGARGRRRAFDEKQALEAAMDMFWEHGYEATSVSQLCAGIGINPPSLYAAFGSKAQLFINVVDHYERTFWDPVWDTFDQEPRVAEAFKRFFEDFVDVITAPGPHLGCLVVHSAVSLEDRDSDVARALAAIGDDGVRRFQGKLDLGIRSGQIPAGSDTLALAHAINMLSEGLALRAHDGVPAEMLRRQMAAGLRMIPEAG
ncbi:TetR/AcrR family transcriptional regulator [Paenarthrobacter nicotinovorans]|uniref:TetR/AcrR family transcriptional regulator n=1 Tax=Paenarthrobacter nicotinovorans TaxID=29320 RepID=UPI00057D3F4D|nr:TetR/AcrR family transcriptional regulator [Paenarthrobacter nicotinovorans]MBP2392794.1 AcrR family transcriptional regulator [Paenarthrobacter nicotinovorans]UKF00908.1 TetR/AcrR family transcriptional regulator [Paenarthrobacter nicotinovorans]UKF05691.1 TetR/AcrR family transcriptional regulator [Paenarthrobacter nicotinovorans]